MLSESPSTASPNPISPPASHKAESTSGEPLAVLAGLAEGNPTLGLLWQGVAQSHLSCDAAIVARLVAEAQGRPSETTPPLSPHSLGPRELAAVEHLVQAIVMATTEQAPSETTEQTETGAERQQVHRNGEALTECHESSPRSTPVVLPPGPSLGGLEPGVAAAIKASIDSTARREAGLTESSMETSHTRWQVYYMKAVGLPPVGVQIVFVLNQFVYIGVAQV